MSTYYLNKDTAKYIILNKELIILKLKGNNKMLKKIKHEQDICRYIIIFIFALLIFAFLIKNISF